uniref:Uncharacterized protein n=1 Tax=Anguilla anguilla TaxID=7936 RepID=A0A0E9SP81_ANGAN
MNYQFNSSIVFFLLFQFHKAEEQLKEPLWLHGKLTGSPRFMYTVDSCPLTPGENE